MVVYFSPKVEYINLPFDLLGNLIICIIIIIIIIIITTSLVQGLTHCGHLYRDSLKRMVADQFPLKSTELPVGTPQYHDYISAIDKVSCVCVCHYDNGVMIAVYSCCKLW